MLARLATFLYAHGRRVLLLGFVCAAGAGVLGAGVAKNLWPYGAKDPATQSVQATNRFQAAAVTKWPSGPLERRRRKGMGLLRESAAEPALPGHLRSLAGFLDLGKPQTATDYGIRRGWLGDKTP